MTQPSGFNYLLPSVNWDLIDLSNSADAGAGKTIESITKETREQACVDRYRIIEALFAHGCFQLGQFEIEKGRTSPYTLSLDRCYSGMLLNQIARLFTDKIRGIHDGPDFIISLGGETAHLASAVAMSLTAYRQKEVSFCCLSAQVPKLEKKSVIIVDTMVITGNRLFEAIEKIEGLEGRVERVVTFFDPDEIRDKNTPFSVSQSLYMRNIYFYSLTSIQDVMDYLSLPEVNKPTEVAAIKSYRKIWGAHKDLSNANRRIFYTL